MTTVQQIYEEMQCIAPLALAESWDNPGLLVDCGGEVSRVLVTLDITPEVVEEAARKGCGLIVSHHPVIFSPLKKLSGQDVAFQLVKNGISAICMHTNLDAAEGGVAEELLRRPEISYPLVAGIIGWGEEITPMLAERLETEIKYAGYIARQDRMIREVARHEKTLIPEDFEYAALTGLTLEAREKLARIRPRNLGQAGRIPGVSPSDVAQLSIALAGKQQK